MKSSQHGTGLFWDTYMVRGDHTASLGRRGWMDAPPQSRASQTSMYTPVTWASSNNADSELRVQGGPGSLHF